MRPLPCAAAVATLLAIALVLPTERARACDDVLRMSAGQPAAGATGVPTNVAPWLWVNDRSHEGVTIRLTDSTGMPVDADVEWLEGYVLASYVVIRPRADLAPDTFYDINVEGAATTTGEAYYRFTTGSSPATGSPPALGDLQMQIASNEVASSCGDDTFACLGLEHAGVVQATVTREGGELEAEMIVPLDGSFRYARTLAPTAIPFCVELRARDVAGRLGPPSTVCSDEADVFSVYTTNPVTCSGHRVVYEGMFADEAGGSGDGGGGGCSAAPGRGGTGGTAAVLLLALLGIIRRARTRPSRTA